MMKISKWEKAVICVAALFLAFTGGWVLRGRTTDRPVRVETQRALAVTETALPAPTAVPKAEPVNVNTAGVEELMALPGIGEKRAADIVADREANGPFRYPEELTRVKGIGEETVAGLDGYITVGEENP